jgi:hypothetical protein
VREGSKEKFIPLNNGSEFNEFCAAGAPTRSLVLRVNLLFGIDLIIVERELAKAINISLI